MKPLLETATQRAAATFKVGAGPNGMAIGRGAESCTA